MYRRLQKLNKNYTMTLDDFNKKMDSDANIASISLSNKVSRGDVNDSVHDGDILIIPDSVKGYEDKRTKAVFVILKKENGDGVQVFLSVFDRSIQPYEKDNDEIVIPSGERVNAEGNVVSDWKKAINVAKFFEDNKGKKLKFGLKATVKTVAWDRKLNDWSSTQLQERKVYDVNWV